MTDTPAMHFRRERVRIETQRHDMIGVLQLPTEGYRSRTTDFLNAHEREFLALTDVEVTWLDGSRAPQHHDYLAVATRHVAGENVIAEACLAKQTAVEASSYVCDEAVQLHGGMGYLRGTEVERHYRDARILPIGGGATEVLTDLAARLLGYAS